jgi:hypothetical protein
MVAARTSQLYAAQGAGALIAALLAAYMSSSRNKGIPAISPIPAIFLNAAIIVTADHGELFGEDGYFGHGPIQHEKVWEVPFVEGKVR